MSDRSPDGSDSLLHFSESEVITVLVGIEKHAFYIQKQLLWDKVPYFKACLKKSWRRGDSPVLLDDIDVEGFRIVVRWLFNEDTTALWITDDGRLFGTAFKVADQLMITELQNKLIDEHLQSLREQDQSHDFETLDQTRINGIEHTPYHQLVLKSATKAFMERQFSPVTLKNTIYALPDKDQLQEIIISIHNYLANPWPEVIFMDQCEFHIHKKGEKCPRNKTKRSASTEIVTSSG